MKRSKFAGDENGALLVFFALCAAAIFLVAALSFDLGRRASTQTELQSFADNVALSAAGELNGLPGAIDRSKRAAANLIADSYVFGTEADGEAGRTLAGEGDYEIFFYEELPALDTMALPTPLAHSAENDSKARFAQVVVKDVDVDWAFARLLTLFSDTPLPDEAVDAEALAGYTSLACDVAPVFFCLPRDPDDPTQVHPDWSVDTIAGSTGENGTGGYPNIGKAIQLRAGSTQGGGGQGGFWEPGNFTWLDVRDQVPEDAWAEDGVLFQTNHPCAIYANSPNSINMYECLFAAGSGTSCFTNGELATKTGQSEGNIAAVFNTRFDHYAASSNNVDTNPIYKPAPIVTKGYVAGDGCSGGGEAETNTTMSFPSDDCITGASGAGGCPAYNEIIRFGDGDWSLGRDLYVDVNYSTDPLTVGEVKPGDVLAGGEMITAGGNVYHVNDPFRPEVTQADNVDYFEAVLDGDGNPTGEYVNKFPKQSWAADFPTLTPAVGADGRALVSRWDYYRAEVAMTLFAAPGDVFSIDGNGNVTYDDTGEEPLSSSARLELIQDILDEDGSTVFDRLGASLPQCSTSNGTTNNFDTDPRRRTLIAAAIDCAAEEVQGNTTDMEALYFLEVFLLGPSGDVVEPGTGNKKSNTKMEIHVEVISPALGIGAGGFEPGLFPDFVQLYK